jgi:hypothetical protein
MLVEMTKLVSDVRIGVYVFKSLMWFETKEFTEFVEGTTIPLAGLLNTQYLHCTEDLRDIIRTE